MIRLCIEYPQFAAFITGSIFGALLIFIGYYIG